MHFTVDLYMRIYHLNLCHTCCRRPGDGREGGHQLKDYKEAEACDLSSKRLRQAHVPGDPLLLQ